jgi:hypothetical protein
MMDSYSSSRSFLGLGLAFGHGLILALHILLTHNLLPPMIKIFSI